MINDRRGRAACLPATTGNDAIAMQHQFSIRHKPA
jgi:hypothetical protein